MTPCIGWPATDECPEHGDMHGCTEDDGHRGRHRCACGAVHVGRMRRCRGKAKT